MKKLIVLLSIVLFSCSPIKEVTNNQFTMDNNIVYVNGDKYATMESINYSIVDSKEVYEVVFKLDTNADQSVTKEFVNYIMDKKPNWGVKVENNFKNLEAHK
jgi:hypothetical protein